MTWFVHETSRKRSTRGTVEKVFFGLREQAQGSRIRYTAGCLRWWKKKGYLDQPVGKAGRERQVYKCALWCFVGGVCVDEEGRERQQLRRRILRTFLRVLQWPQGSKGKKEKMWEGGYRVGVWNEGKEAGQSRERKESESGCVWWASWHWLALAGTGWHLHTSTHQQPERKQARSKQHQQQHMGGKARRSE